MTRLRHRSPAFGCACATCRAARRQRLSELSAAQRRALAGLDRRIPRHLDDLRSRGITAPTLASLMADDRDRPALAFQLDLRRPLLGGPYFSFAVLTDQGLDHFRAGRRLGLLP